MRNRRVELVRRLWADERGPTSVEYAILAGGIAVVIIGAVGLFGVAVRGLFERVVW